MYVMEGHISTAATVDTSPEALPSITPTVAVVLFEHILGALDSSLTPFNLVRRRRDIEWGIRWDKSHGRVSSRSRPARRCRSTLRMRHRRCPQVIQARLRNRLCTTLRRAGQRGELPPIMDVVGLSQGQLMAYLESRFQPGMTRSNYGMWHVDHIRPVSSFDHTDMGEVRECWHYTNLQPLWARDNLRKGCRLVRILV
jgi:hypothetical protein